MKHYSAISDFLKMDDQEKAVDGLSSYLISHEISELELIMQVLHSQSIKILSDVLMKNKTLIKLDLKLNLINAKGLACLTQALMVNSTLKVLDLSWNQISPYASIMFGRVIEENNALTHLSLAFNQIDDVGVEALGQSLIKNKTLVHLDLNNNHITDKGVQSLLDSIRLIDGRMLDNFTLSLDYNRNSLDASKKVKKALIAQAACMRRQALLFGKACNLFLPIDIGVIAGEYLIDPVLLPTFRRGFR